MQTSKCGHGLRWESSAISFDVVASLVCGSFPISVCGDLIREIAHPPHVERETDVPEEDKSL